MPIPVVVTGGIVSGFWRLVGGIDAFDLLEDQINIIPFLPTLVDDKEHTFEIQLVGIEDDRGHGELTQSTQSKWVVTSKSFLWLDTDTSVVTGLKPPIHIHKASINVFSKVTRTPDNAVASLDYSIQVARAIQTMSTLHTLKGAEEIARTQNLAFLDYDTLSNNCSDQDVRQNTSGLNESPASTCVRRSAYPFWVASTYGAPLGGGLTIDATMRRGKTVEQIGELAFHNAWVSVATEDASFRGSRMTDLQNGTAFHMNIPAQKSSYSTGSTE
jgi:hypothetical protein